MLTSSVCFALMRATYLSVICLLHASSIWFKMLRIVCVTMVVLLFNEMMIAFGVCCQFLWLHSPLCIIHLHSWHFSPDILILLPLCFQDSLCSPVQQTHNHLWTFSTSFAWYDPFEGGCAIILSVKRYSLQSSRSTICCLGIQIHKIQDGHAYICLLLSLLENL